MTDKKLKTKDMVIAVFCTFLAILSIVFYFLPAFNVQHRASPSQDYTVVNYSGWDMTRVVFTDTIYYGSGIEGLQYIKDAYSFAIMISGILMPIGILSIIATTVFTYLSWLKSETFKKFCFLFSLCGMMFMTLTLVSTWFVAIQIKDGNNFGFFNYNLKGSIAYASFVSLIIAFVVAIIACAYNYFLDNFDEEYDEDDDDYYDEDEDEEYERRKARRKRRYEEDEDEEEETIKKPTNKLTLKVEEPEATPGKFVANKSTSTKSTEKTSTTKKIGGQAKK